MGYEELEVLIESLQAAVHNENPEKGYWRKLWSLVKEVRSGFKGTRFPSPEQNKAAWDKVNRLVSEAEARSEREKEERIQRERAWEARQERSMRVVNSVNSQIGQTAPISGLEHMIGSVILAPIMMIESMLRTILGLEQLDEMHEDLKNCSYHMKQAWQVFNDNKRAMLPGDKNQVYQDLVSAQERLNQAWESWKRAKNDFHERSRAEYEQRQRNKAEKHREFVRRVEANIENLEEKISKAEYALQHQRNHLENLRDQYSSAWNDSFKDRCSDWIDEAETRISDIEGSIDRMRGWIENERDKLR